MDRLQAAFSVIVHPGAPSYAAKVKGEDVPYVVFANGVVKREGDILQPCGDSVFTMIDKTVDLVIEAYKGCDVLFLRSPLTVETVNHCGDRPANTLVRIRCVGVKL